MPEALVAALGSHEGGLGGLVQKFEGAGLGGVISSWLLDLTATSLQQDPTLSQFSGHVADSGEGRWTIMAAIDEAVPVPVLTSALFERFESRGEAGFINQVLSAMRYQFGGHVEK